MKFNIKWVLAAVLLALVGLAAAPWTVSQSAQIVAIEKQIKSGSSVRLVSHGRSVFAVLPRPHIRIYDANLDFDEGVQRSRRRACASTLACPGCSRAGSTSPVRPGRRRAHARSGALRRSLPSSPGVQERRARRPARSQVTNGTALLRRTGGAKPELIADDCEARLDFSRASAPVSLIGHCSCRPRRRPSPTRFAVWAANPTIFRVARKARSPCAPTATLCRSTLTGRSPWPPSRIFVAGSPARRRRCDGFAMVWPDLAAAGALSRRLDQGRRHARPS